MHAYATILVRLGGGVEWANQQWHDGLLTQCRHVTSAGAGGLVGSPGGAGWGRAVEAHVQQSQPSGPGALWADEVGAGVPRGQAGQNCGMRETQAKSTHCGTRCQACIEPLQLAPLGVWAAAEEPSRLAAQAIGVLGSWKQLQGLPETVHACWHGHARGRRPLSRSCN